MSPTEKPARTKADEFFEADMRFQNLKCQMEDALYAIHGWDAGSDDPAMDCPAQEWTHDGYDYSWEWKETRPGWVPTPEQQQAVYDLGFLRFWVCYTDGTERYFVRGGDPGGYFKDRNQYLPWYRRFLRRFGSLPILKRGTSGVRTDGN